MKRLTPEFLILLFIFITTNLFAQQGYIIKGTVQDSNKVKIPEGEILLISKTNNTVIKSELITEGNFILKSIAKGDYTLQVVSLGYDDLFREITLNKDETLDLVLNRSSQYNLDEVVVTGSKKTFITKNGNTKVAIKGSVFETIPNPLDLLQKLPGVLISNDKEAVSVVGRGNALIYIDKQKATINDLNALSVAEIESVEIIKNPSSKYEAEGRALILITRIKNKRDRFETVVTETASLKKRFNNYLGVNPSYKSGNLELRGNINYNQLNPWEGLGNTFELEENQWESAFNANSFTKRRQFIIGAGLYYEINEDDYLSLNVNGKLQKDKDTNTANTFTLDQADPNSVVTLNNNDETRDFVNAYLGYNNKLKSIDANLFAGFQYSSYMQKSESVIRNNFNDTQFDLSQQRNQQFDVKVATGRVDFEKQLIPEINLEAGLLYLSADASTDFNVTDYVTNDNPYSVYLYKENNSAAYTQASGTVKNISYQVGVRAENTDVTGKFSGEDSPAVDRNYTNLFPKAQISFPLDSLNSVSLNYAKSIARPNYSSTSQTSIYTNPYVVFSRNLNLNPTITDEISLGYQRGDKSISLNLFTIKDPVYFGYVYDETDDIINFSSVNYEKELGFNLELTIPVSYKMWSSVNTLSMMYNDIKDVKAVAGNASPYLYYYTNQMLKFSSRYNVMVSALGFTERSSGVFKRNAVFTMNAAANKTFFNRLDVTFSFNDIFRGLKFTEGVNINGINSNAIYTLDGREVSLSVRYVFGKLKDSKYKDKNINENTNRIN
ncbi:outer membrane beta-barrel family protein [Flavobacterium sp. ST-75]|uniref:Outer membrane beta-barrel family protein n=1 Tax=Flavobacterium rhizophilum TaxID=3163296 RepID=A0ABW8YBK4_9FLAO